MVPKVEDRQPRSLSRLSDLERQTLRENWPHIACPTCGNRHFGQCPRIVRMVRKIYPNGRLAEEEYVIDPTVRLPADTIYGYEVFEIEQLPPRTWFDDPAPEQSEVDATE